MAARLENQRVLHNGQERKRFVYLANETGFVFMVNTVHTVSFLAPGRWETDQEVTGLDIDVLIAQATNEHLTPFQQEYLSDSAR